MKVKPHITRLKDRATSLSKTYFTKIRNWIATHPVIYGLITSVAGLVLGTKADSAILSFLLGSGVTWFAAWYFYKRASKEMPEWVEEKLLPSLPTQEPSPENLTKIIYDALSSSAQYPILENGSNSDGHWVRYKTGKQTCSGTLVIPAGKSSATIPFPSPFDDTPLIDISGEINNETTFSANPTTLTIKTSKLCERPNKINYQARGISITPEMINNPAS